MIFTETTLGLVTESIQTGPFGSQLHSSDYSEEGTPVIMPQDIVDWKISEEKIARVNEEHVNRLKRHKCKVDDIIYPRRGDLAKCAFITTREQDWLCGTGCLKVSVDESKAIPKYVYFHLQQPYSINSIEVATVGSTMPNLNTSILSKIKLRLPSLEDQKKVVDILSEYDELIEVNQRRISILEEMAMRTYSEWFVYFRFPGHESYEFENGLPKGWKKEAAQHFFEISIGKTPPRKESQWFTAGDCGLPWLSISDMKGGCFVFSSSENLTEDAISKHNIVIVNEDTILLSFKLTVGRVSIAAVPMCTNEAIAHFKTDDPYKREYCYCYLKGFSFETLGSTSSIATAINSKTVKKMPFILPSIEILEAFSDTTRSIFDEIKVIQRSIIKLKQIRDCLLPQLMSGQLDVSC